MKHPPGSRGGFTLIEVLVSLAILSTILVIILSSFTGAGRTRELLTDRARESRQVAMLLDRLGTDLIGAVSAARLPDTAFTCKEDSFSGRSVSTMTLTVFTLPSESLSRPSTDMVKVKYFPRVTSDGAFVDLYRETSDLPLIENRISTREIRIAANIREFRVESFDGTAWRKEWPPSAEKKGLLPPKVAVTLVDERGESHRREISLPLSGQEGNVLFSGKRARTTP